MPAFMYVWEFTVAPGQEPGFLELYGPEGAWVRLFRTASGYIDTRLLRSAAEPARFATIDRWESEAAFRRFRREYAAEFEAIDAAGARLTVHERLIGEYTEIG